MKTKILLIALTILFLNNLSLADIVPTGNAEQNIVIKVTQNYPDYSFYICSYQQKRVAPFGNDNVKVNNTNPNIYNGYEIFSFNLKNIELNPQTPYKYQARYNSEAGGMYLVAVKKEIEVAVKPVLKDKILNYFQPNHTNNDGVYVVGISQTLDFWKTSITVVNEVTNLDENGLKTKVYDGKDQNKSQFCAGIFIAFAILIGGISFLRKRK